MRVYGGGRCADTLWAGAQDVTLAILILPMPAFPFGQPFDCRANALRSRSVVLRFGYPFEIIALRRRGEPIERRLCLGRLGQRRGEFRMDFGRWLGCVLGLAGRRRASGQLGALADDGV